MDEMLRELYSRYVATLRFYNSRLDEGPGCADERASFRLHVLPEEDFPAWWTAISLDREIQERWLERFADPAAALARARKRITEELHQIPFRRAAA